MEAERDIGPIAKTEMREQGVAWGRAYHTSALILPLAAVFVAAFVALRLTRRVTEKCTSDDAAVASVICWVAFLAVVGACIYFFCIHLDHAMEAWFAPRLYADWVLGRCASRR